MKHVAQQISPAYRAIYSSQLLKANLLPETIVSQAQSAYIYLIEFNNNDSRIQCEMCPKLTIEAPDTVLMSLLLS